MYPGPRREAEAIDGVLRCNEQGRGSVRDLTRDGGGENTTVGERCKCGHLLQGRVGARPFVRGNTDVRGDLALEVPIRDGSECAPVALEGEAFVVLAAQIPLAGDHLGAAELRDFLVAETLQPTPASGPRVRAAERLARGEGAEDGELAHLLHAAGDDEVRGTAHDCLGGEVHGLLGGTALAIDGDTGHGFG